MSNVLRGRRRPRLDERRVVVARIGDEAVLFDLRTYAAARANAVAARALAVADGAHTVRQMAALLAAEFDVPLPRVHEDLDHLLAELERRGYLRARRARGR